MKGIFGRKKAEQQENPYAQQQAQEEYDRMSPYQRARADVASNGPRPNIPGGLPSGPGPRRDYGGSPSPSTTSYGGSTYANSSRGYGSERYGTGSGYGNNRYESNSNAYSANQNAPPARTGGYGGLGGRPEEDVNKEELFSGATRSDNASNRYGPRVPQQGDNPNRYATAGAPQPGYEEDDGYADQDLTPEQQEEREYQKIRAKTKQIRQENLSSTERTLAMLDQAEETGMRTLANLGSQGERLNRVEQNLNMSAVHARNAEAKTKELKTLNRSMFAVHVENPLTKKKRLAAQEQAVIDQARADRGEHEAVRGAGYREQQNMETFFSQMDQHRAGAPAKKDKYDFDDSDEPESEDEMAWKKQETHNIQKISHGLQRVKLIADEQGRVIRDQDSVIGRIGDKTDGVTDHVVKNSAKLRTFK